jgi:hypothetical protein
MQAKGLLPDGRVPIHFFVHDPDGPVTTPIRTVMFLGPKKMGGARGYVACKPKEGDVAPHTDKRGQPVLCVFASHPSAVTCPQCLATDACKDMAANLENVRGQNTPALQAKTSKRP